MYKKVLAIISVLFALWAGLIAAGLTQELGPSSYSILHTWGVADATTADCRGMGNAYAASDTFAAGNPASLSGITKTRIIVSQARTTFDGGIFENKLKVDVTDFRLLLSIMGFGINTGPTTVTTNTIRSTQLVNLPLVNYTDVNSREEDFVFCVGRKFGKNSPFSWGIGTSPKIKTKMDINGPPGVFRSHIDSNVIGGFRYGLLYQNKKFNLGVFYDGYREEAKQETNYVFLPQPQVVEDVFDSKIFRSGILWKPTDNTKLSLDWRNGTFSGRTYVMKIDTLHYGISHRFGKLNLQAGVNDTQPTAGITYCNQGLFIKYYYMKNRDDRLFKDLFGSSTTHGLELEYRF